MECTNVPPPKKKNVVSIIKCNLLGTDVYSINKIISVFPSVRFCGCHFTSVLHYSIWNDCLCFYLIIGHVTTFIFAVKWVQMKFLSPNQHSVSLLSTQACLCSRLLLWRFNGECSVRSSNDLAGVVLGGKFAPCGESLLESSSMVAIRGGSGLGSEVEVWEAGELLAARCSCMGRAAKTEGTGALMIRFGAPSTLVNMSRFWEKETKMFARTIDFWTYMLKTFFSPKKPIILSVLHVYQCQFL